MSRLLVLFYVGILRGFQFGCLMHIPEVYCGMRFRHAVIEGLRKDVYCGKVQLCYKNVQQNVWCCHAYAVQSCEV